MFDKGHIPGIAATSEVVRLAIARVVIVSGKGPALVGLFILRPSVS
jgi:hypothetical protein